MYQQSLQLSGKYSRAKLASGSTAAQLHHPTCPGTALLVTWEDAPNSDQVAAAGVCRVLQDGFGYNLIQLHLRQTDPEAALKSQVESLLENAQCSLNPFFLYYRGNGTIKHGKPFWRLDNNTAALDWLNIQVLLENCRLDTILALDCDYGVIPTRNKDGKGQSVFHLASIRKAVDKTGKLEIIAAPQKVQGAQQSFSQALASALEIRQDSPFFLNCLLADLQKSLGNAIIHKNLSSIANGGMIKMTPMCSYFGEPKRSKTNGAHHKNNDKELAAMVQKWTGYSQWSTVLPAQEIYYRKVVVLPIIWEFSDWDAKGEIDVLKTTFKTYFDYQVEETFKIVDHVDAQECLEKKIRSYVDQALITTLSQNDLLIILYNGHGMDGYQNSCDLMWTSGEDPRYRGRISRTINWTKIVRMLDTAPCDVVQVLDCCFAATAVKSGRHDETKLLDHIHKETPEAAYRGKNEILASCGRDSETAAGRNSSMPLFAEVLGALASKRMPLSVYSWFHEVDSEVVRRNTQNSAQGTPRPRHPPNWYYSPSWKYFPKEIWPRSIILKPKPTTDIAESVGTSGYIYAKIKIEMGRPTGVSYHMDKDMR